MIKSMTAYGSGEYLQGEMRYFAEIRSLNNRYRDIILRIPNDYRPLEEDLKSVICSKIIRGRIDVSITMENGGEQPVYDLELNMPLIESYSRIFDQLADRLGLDQNISLESLLQMKDVILTKTKEADCDKARPGFIEVLTRALDSLNEMRIKEGDAIEKDFVKRLNLLDRYVDKADERASRLPEEYRNRLQANVQRILSDIPVDEVRLAQEVAFLAERSDITEEIVRIRSHLRQFREYLSIDEAVGRRLDFLIQEINREVNTLGAKASDAFISKVVVEIKSELEKLREQVQNVE